VGTLGVGEQSPGGWLMRDQCAYLLRVPDGQIEPNESAAATAEYIRRFGAKLGEQAVSIVAMSLCVSMRCSSSGSSSGLRE